MADESGTPGDELTLEANVVQKRPRRRALWGVLAAVAVAAGALAVTAGGEDDDLPTLPVALGAAASAERDSAAGTMAAPATADMRMGWITYVAGDDLPALGGEGPAYRLDGAIDEDRVRALAETLGLDGDLRQEDGYWHVEDGGAVLEVYEGGSWWYSLPVENSGGGTDGCEPGPAVDCGVVEPLPADAPPATIVGSVDRCTNTGVAADGTKVVEECAASASASSTDEPCPPEADCAVPLPTPVEPQPPADLPSKGDAQEIALDLLRDTGIDVDAAKVTVDGPYDAWYVSVEPTVDGLPVSGWYSSVAVGSKGAIVSAAGLLARPERLGDYPLLDTRAAIDRLNEQQGSWFAYAPGAEGARPAIGVAEDTAVGGCAEQPDGTELCSESFEAVGQPIECMEAGVAPPAGDDVPTTIVSDCSYPEPEPVEYVLHDAERVLVLLPSVDGTGDSYLLSGYRFSGDDGVVAEVAAVVDEQLAPTTTTVPSTDTTIPPDAPDGIEPSDAELRHLSDGEQPELGVPYYVDVNTHCGWFVFGDRWWATDASTPLPWATPTEGGTFTLSGPDAGTFVGDAPATKTADFTARGPAEELPICD